MDDPFVSCPYEPAHRVPRSRFQKHIVNCEWKQPELQACPYNATHRVTKEDFQVHLINCPSALAVFPKEKLGASVVASLTTPKITLQKAYLPKTDPDHEDWDD